MNPFLWFLILAVLMLIAHIWIFIIDITAGVLSIAIVFIFAVMMGVLVKGIMDSDKHDVNHEEDENFDEYTEL